MKCKCGSHAINNHMHGRDGSDADLCDVCYWRSRADKCRAALEQIKRIDEKRQFGSCPDCDHESWCNSNKACKSMPHSEVGNIAAKALEECDG